MLEAAEIFNEWPIRQPLNSCRFSVIIPTYQRRQLVLKTVHSLVNQEFPGSFEVIVVVDGSQDGTAQALRELRTCSRLVRPEALARFRPRREWALR